MLWQSLSLCTLVNRDTNGGQIFLQNINKQCLQIPYLWYPPQDCVFPAVLRSYYEGLSFPNLIELLRTGFISWGSPLFPSCCWFKGRIHALAMISTVNRRSGNNKENINNKANANVMFALLKCGLWRFFFLGAPLVAQRLKHLPAMRETWVRSLGQEDPLKKEMATHSSILAWRIPRTEELGGLQSMGSQRVGHD